eukprot:scaffold25675_cov50-Attheya_sp.AAC.4
MAGDDDMESSEWQVVAKETAVRRYVPQPLQLLFGGGSAVASGVVVAESEENLKRRQPALVRCALMADGGLATAAAGNQEDDVVVVEDLTREEFEAAHSLSQKRVSSMNSVEPEDAFRSIVEDRRLRRLEHEVQETYMGKLVLVAAWECCRELRLEQTYHSLLKRQQQQAPSGKRRFGSRSSSSSNEGAEPPKYYRQPPQSYLVAPTLDTSFGGGAPQDNATEEQEEHAIVVTPSQVAHRCKTGLALAYRHYHELTSQARRSTRTASSQQGLEHEPGGHVAQYLLQQLHLLPSTNEENSESEQIDGDKENTLADEDEVEEEEEEEEESEEEEEEEEEEDEEMSNPFFAPTPLDILEYLGRKSHGTSPSQIQAAICAVVDDDGIPTPSFFDDQPQEEEEEGQQHVKLVCTTEDKVSDLPEYEPASFSRCKFALQYHTPVEEEESDSEEEEEETEEEKLQRKELAKQEKLERKQQAELDYHKQDKIYKKQKAQAIWRYRGIHTGCTIMEPSWKPTVDSIEAAPILTTATTTATIKPSAAPAETSTGLASGDTSTDVPAGVNGDVTPGLDPQEAADLALAQSLSSQDAVTATITTTGTRRTTRRAIQNPSTDGGPVVYYGSHSTLTTAQLVTTLYRLLVKSAPSTLTLMDMVRLVTDDLTQGNEIKRVRMAIGKLLWQLGKIQRLPVQIVTTPPQGPFILVRQPQPVAAIQNSMELTTSDDSLVRDVKAEEHVAAMETDVVALPEDPMVVTSTAKSNKMFDPELASALESYLFQLHVTELKLRKLVLDAIVEREGGVSLVATAADERPGDWESMDGEAFAQHEGENDDSKIDWQPTGHDWIGKRIYRPSVTSTAVKTAKDSADASQGCTWFKIVEFTPSILLSENNTNSSATAQATAGGQMVGKENRSVERRARFRVELAVTSESNNVSLILTEAQVYAGLSAAKMAPHEITASQDESASLSLCEHPFGSSKMGSHIQLIAIDSSQIGMYGTVVGHDSVEKEDQMIQHMILILPDEETNTAIKQDDSLELTEDNSFWAIVLASSSSNDSLICETVEGGVQYKIRLHDYDKTSSAYQACESILEYLENHAKCGPFLEPVDPVALQLHDYLTIIKRPMDISTVRSNLEKGMYSKSLPPPSPENGGAVTIILNGPFRDDILLIFDNAMLYNQQDSWIHSHSSLLRRSVLKKMEQASASRDEGRGKRAIKKKSMYVDEDSDVDMYTYESDEDDEYDGDGRRKRKRRGNKSSKKASSRGATEENSTKAIEAPIRVPSTSLTGPLSNLPVSSSSDQFTLPSKEWMCRHKKSGASEPSSQENQTDTSKKEEMEQLIQLQLENGTDRETWQLAPF